MVLSLALLAVVGHRCHQRYFSQQASILFWDVGQGDSQLISLPFGKNYLLDTGGGRANRRIGNELFLELSRKGILRLQALLVSHPDEDHASGALELFRHLVVDELWLHSGFKEEDRKSRLLTQLRADTKSRAIPIREFSSTEVISGKNFHLKVVPLFSKKGVHSNNTVLVTELEVYGCRFLFLGDLEKEGEMDLTRLIRPDVTVLKVGHHGSLTSSSLPFVRYLNPRYAIISVGQGNPYGHPRKEVIARFQDQGAQVLRTDFHGYVEFKISPEGKLACYNALGSCGTYFCRQPETN